MKEIPAAKRWIASRRMERRGSGEKGGGHRRFSVRAFLRQEWVHRRFGKGKGEMGSGFNAGPGGTTAVPGGGPEDGRAAKDSPRTAAICPVRCGESFFPLRIE